MLGVGPYLLGVVELLVLVGFAWLGAGTVRRRLVPELDGLVAQLATALLAIAGLLWIAELLGTFGWFMEVPYLVAVAIVGLALWLLVERGRGRLSVLLGFSPGEDVAVRDRKSGEKEDATAAEGRPRPLSPAALVA